MRTGCGIKVRKDGIFKKYVDTGYPRAFAYSVLNTLDDTSAHQDYDISAHMALG